MNGKLILRLRRWLILKLAGGNSSVWTFSHFSNSEYNGRYVKLP